VTVVRLKYIHGYKDRHGQERYYLRRPGAAKVALPGKPGSPEFMAAYHCAVEHAKPTEKKAGAPAAGSINAAAISWYSSPAFTRLKPTTQIVYRRILDRFREEFGNRPIALLQPEHVTAILEKRADTPAAANHLLRMLRLMMKHAISKKMIRTDPTRDIERMKLRNPGFHTWTDAEIEQFEACWPIGTKPRLAFELLLYTAQRRSDVVRMGRQHLRPGGLIWVKQQKTGAELEIPIHPLLQQAIDGCPAENLTFLLTKHSKPYTANGFLIMSITGHETLSEVQRYTKAAERRRMAIDAMERIGRAKSGTGIG
jgi:integrase